jgi:ribosomal protein S18 acetylase RimI-like enzyme
MWLRETTKIIKLFHFYPLKSEKLYFNQAKKRTFLPRNTHPRFMIRRFEEISNNAWPALQTLQYDGWLLRFADGVTKRSNSVSMLYQSTMPLHEKIAFCETVYRRHGIAPCFKVTEISTPEGIDEVLKAAGYFIHSRILFMTVNISEGLLYENTEITLTNHWSGGWIDDFISMNGFDENRKPVYFAIMEQLRLNKALVSVVRDGRRVAVGLGILEGKYIGLFDIVVDPSCRRQGLGRQVVGHLMAWGRSEGASMAYLQVLSDNVPAIDLYRKMGFTERYHYWYRMK